MDHGRSGKPRIEARGVNAEPLPETIEVAVLSLFVNVVLVVGDQTDGRMSALPRHTGKPSLEIDRSQRGQEPRVAPSLRTFQPEVVGPGHLLQLECASLADAALIGVRKTAAVDIHRLEARWVQTRERDLGMSGVGETY